MSRMNIFIELWFVKCYCYLKTPRKDASYFLYSLGPKKLEKSRKIEMFSVLNSSKRAHRIYNNLRVREKVFKYRHGLELNTVITSSCAKCCRLRLWKTQRIINFWKIVFIVIYWFSKYLVAFNIQDSSKGASWTT